MKKAKTLVFGLAAVLTLSSSIAVSQEFRYKALENINISKTQTQGSGGLPEDRLTRPNDGIDPVPTCEVNGAVGEIDCFNRLYVDRSMLDKLINGSSVESNEGDVFDSYHHHKINTYHITNMGSLFSGKNVRFDIYEWDVSNVTDMSKMFYEKIDFNQPIGNWDVSSVTNMRYMFYNARSFNQSIGNWNVRNVTNMNSMLRSATNYRGTFNQNLNGWDVCGLVDWGRFAENSFNFISSNMPYFDKKNCINENYDELNFNNQKLVVDRPFLNFLIDNPYNEIVTKDGVRFPMTYSHDDIDVSNITNMGSLFSGKNVRFDIYEWDVSNVTDMSKMFYEKIDFNQPIGNWDVSSVTNMRYMFYNARRFNQPIGDWNVRNVTNMNSMLRSATNYRGTFNQNLNGWDVCGLVDWGRFAENSFNFISSNMPYFDKRNCG